ncbi:MAG: hypothetical protein FJ388_05855 [Verrucomicrobia bacterium]|nr:hypothetical protein [Verrucomicrobiota bacterium]
MKSILRPVLALLAVGLLLGLMAVTGERSGVRPRAGARKAPTGQALLAWVPPGCKSALWVDVRGLQTAPALAGLRTWFWSAERLRGAENFKKSARIDLRNDLDELVVCFDLTNPDSLLIIGVGEFDTAGFVRAFRRSPAVRAQSWNGADVFELTDPKNQFQCIAVLGPRALAAGSRTAVKELLESRAAKASGQTAVSEAQRALSALGDGALVRLVSTQLASLPKVPDVVLKEHNKLLTLAAGFDGDSTAVLRARLELEGADYARRDAKFLQGVLDLLCGTLQASGKSPAGVEELLSSVKIEQQGSAVTVTARAPATLIEGLLARSAVQPRGRGRK